MKKKPNIKIGIIINIALTVLSIVYSFLYYIEKSGFELTAKIGRASCRERV